MILHHELFHITSPLITTSFVFFIPFSSFFHCEICCVRSLAAHLHLVGCGSIAVPQGTPSWGWDILEPVVELRPFRAPIIVFKATAPVSAWSGEFCVLVHQAGEVDTKMTMIQPLCPGSLPLFLRKQPQKLRPMWAQSVSNLCRTSHRSEGPAHSQTKMCPTYLQLDSCT